MDSNELKRQVKEWAEGIGSKEAMKRLVNSDVSVHVAQKLISGNYESAPSLDTANSIVAAMNGKAS